MDDGFDSRKNARNRAKHGIDFANADALEWDAAVTRQDTRYDYGEARFITYAPIDARLYVLVWTVRDGEVRPISLRKANARERKRYEKENAES